MRMEDARALMMSDDFRERTKAEYWELRIRWERLGNMLDKWEDGTLDFTPNCPRLLLVRQYNVMKDYMDILSKRAEIEGIDLEN